LSDARDAAQRKRRSNIRLALVIALVAVGFYLLMFVMGGRW
jgi:predicted nucleic acid-binding Zn ribbon protein